MKAFNIDERKKKILLFSAMLLVSMGLVFLLGTSLTGAGSRETKLVHTASGNITAETSKLFNLNESFQVKLAALQLLDKQYAEAITGANFANKSDSLNKLIQLQEAVLGNIIGDLKESAGSFDNETIKAGFAKMISAYEEVFENRTAIGKLRNALHMQQSDFSTDEKAILVMQDKLQQKEGMITSLQNSIQLMAKSKPAIAPVKNDNSAALLSNITALENSLASITSTNNNLKQENEKLLKQQNESSKNSGNNEMLLKEKTMKLQQKVDALSAEIQLVQVDCNLSRVDAAQIISNAKQRRQLLSDASAILSNLNASGNDEIKRKVKEKIIKLNQVAANSRD